MIRRPAFIALRVVHAAAVAWAGFVLLGWAALAGALAGLVGVSLYGLLTDRTARARERSARGAIREHRDPGPDLRAEADAQARVILAAPPADRWLPGLVSGAIALACVVTGVVRDEPAVAFPAPLLVALAVHAVVLRRRTDAAADRWLADPPFATAEESER
jgi:hypothetical protein